MEQEKEFEQYLGGAPKAVVKEFPKVGELSEEELDFGIGGYATRAIAVEYQMPHTNLLREKSIEAEKQAMFEDLERSKQQENPNQHTM